MHGEAPFAWIDGGAYLRMSTEMEDPRFPDGIAIFGGDDEAKRLFLLSVDERGVSRKYNVRVSAHELHWRRNHPGSSQRVTIAFADGERMVSTGELRQDDSTWESDLSLTCTRIA